MIATFRKALGETGLIEGQNVRIEYRWADEHYDRLPALANQLVRDQVALILAASTPAALAVKPATKTIPIVFAIGGDPVVWTCPFNTTTSMSLAYDAITLCGLSGAGIGPKPDRANTG